MLALLGEHLSNAEIGARLFISVRTVESHVSSLLRKLEVPDRRALSRRAAELARADRSRAEPALRAPLTSFIGRVRERAELAEAIKVHRQVTAVGPGGVGKTRLALAVAAEAAPFTAEAAAEVAGFSPLVPAGVADGLARLAEQSLLAVTPSPAGTRYQALETIRQYGIERLADAGELVDTRSRHMGWCPASAAVLMGETGGDWRSRFDAVTDDLRAALAWAAEQPDRRGAAYRLALSMAELTFGRTLLGESQQRYEQAADLADDLAATASALRHAAAVAGCRMLGDDPSRCGNG